MLCTQQQHRVEKVEELQAEAKRVTSIIQPVHQKVHDATSSIQKIIPEHVSSDLVDQLQKTKEEVQLEVERVAKILEYFHSRVDTTK